MPKGVEKKHLPQKECVVCKRTFVWRKKWEKTWGDVKYCSHKCANNKKQFLRKKNDV